MSISTRRGDEGTTDLWVGGRIAKNDPRIEALGAVDELNAALGPLRVVAERSETQQIVAQVQPWLIVLMGELATDPAHPRQRPSKADQMDSAKTAWLDEWVGRLEQAGAAEVRDWALPGAAGSMAGAWADIARTVCRRAERRVIDLRDGHEAAGWNPHLIPFLNRLSDLLWLAARWEEQPRERQASA